MLKVRMSRENSHAVQVWPTRVVLAGHAHTGAESPTVQVEVEGHFTPSHSLAEGEKGRTQDGNEFIPRKIT